MIGKFIGIEGTNTQITIWIEDLGTHQVNQISADHDVFFEQVLPVFPGASFQQKTVEYAVNEQGILTQFHALDDE